MTVLHSRVSVAEELLEQVALESQQEIQDGRVCTGAGFDRALRLPGQSANPVPAAIRAKRDGRAGVY